MKLFSRRNEWPLGGMKSRVGAKWSCRDEIKRDWFRVVILPCRDAARSIPSHVSGNAGECNNGGRNALDTSLGFSLIFERGLDGQWPLYKYNKLYIIEEMIRNKIG